MTGRDGSRHDGDGPPAWGNDGTAPGISRRRALRAGGLALAVGLAGCESASSPATTTPASVRTRGPVTITFLPSWVTYYGETYREMVAAFNDTHDHTVEFARDLELQSGARDTRSYRNTMEMTFRAAADGNQPDVANLGQIATVRAMDQGIFAPVGEVLGDGFDPATYFPQARRPYTVGGELLTVPFSASNIVMLYNRDAFEAAGLDPSSPPATFDRFRTAMESVVDEGVAEYGCTWPNAAWWPISWFAESDQLMYDRQNGHAGSPTETYLQSETGRRIYQWWTDLGRDGLYLNPGIEAWGAAATAFLEGRTAVTMTSSGSMVSLLSRARDPETGAGEMDVGIASLVRPGDRQVGHGPGGSALWAKQGLSGRRQEAVADFLRFLTAPEQQALWHRRTGYLPTNPGAVDILTESGWFTSNPELANALDQFQSWEDRPATWGTTLGPAPEVRSTLAREADSMLRGIKSVDRALADADREIQLLLANYRRQL